MVYRPFCALYIVVAAVVGGIVLAKGHYIGGAILVAIAFGIYAAWRRVEKRGEDDTFTLR